MSQSKRSRYISSDSSSDEQAENCILSQDKDLHQKHFAFNNVLKNKQKYAYEVDKKIKCSNRNAIMARENRKRKKLYVQNLEKELKLLKNDKGKLRSIIDSQSLLISSLQKEINYLKSVLANSSDISNLIKNIRSSTGMCVTTSLDNTMTLNDSCVSKPKHYVASKTAHPWEELNQSSCDDSTLDRSTSDNLNDDFSNALNDLPVKFEVDFPDLDIKTENQYSLDEYFESDSLNTSQITENAWSDHNYSNMPNEIFEDVGVCLHVSQHRVSLEFCSSCTENAAASWGSSGSND